MRVWAGERREQRRQSIRSDPGMEEVALDSLHSEQPARAVHIRSDRGSRSRDLLLKRAPVRAGQ